MGQEVGKAHFAPEDFNRFRQRLVAETEYLGGLFARGDFHETGRTIGLEVETCLVDGRFAPAPRNTQFLKTLRGPRASLIGPELSRFNIEINTLPQILEGPCFEKIHADLRKTWREVSRAARSLGIRAVTIGCLPTMSPEDLTLRNMSSRNRYRALNEQIMRHRHGRDLSVRIQGLGPGGERLKISQDNVMLEAATTSLQIHLQFEPDRSVRYYNAALVASAPMAALCANAPFLFGKDLWDETRIPLFEEAVNLPSFQYATGRILRRVTLGTDYLRGSLHELFLENLNDYPVLLPLVGRSRTEALAHLRLHNGTVWRWNRPILGPEAGGGFHLRLEHRVPSAGPTLTDMVANTAFAAGLFHSLAEEDPPVTSRIPFAVARQNFYRAAQWGLGAEVHWTSGRRGPLRDLFRKELLPRAREGLRRLGIEEADIRSYLIDVVGRRIRTGRTASVWQREFVARHGRDMTALTRRYQELQETDEPVSTWKV